MGRTKDSKNNKTYHFVVYYKCDPDEEEIHKKYYMKTEDITEDFGICRSTIYNYYTNVNNKKKNKAIQSIEKLSTPVQKYKKIEVVFD
jgi:hypothetical protein|tara:strand:+ start:9635 stop:9898 length:264 start_codon:yes stop_codon:yes gene_type:complete